MIGRLPHVLLLLLLKLLLLLGKEARRGARSVAQARAVGFERGDGVGTPPHAVLQRVSKFSAACSGLG
ncbi:hypothetical protein HK405_002139, partial [Cladochytrium tenue]